MINVLVIFLALAILFILGIGCFVVGVNACDNDKADDTTLTLEEAKNLKMHCTLLLCLVRQNFE